MNNENLFEIGPRKGTELKNLSKRGFNIIIEKTVYNKIIAIYDKNMYPLLTAKKNEYFEIYSSKDTFKVDHNFILKYSLNSLIAIYEVDGNKLFEINKNQKAEITKGIKDFSAYPYITIYKENGNVTIFDIESNKTIYESTYANSKLEISFENSIDLILEKINGEIKVISLFNGSKLVASDNCYFEFMFQLFILDYLFIKEISTDKKSNSIYIYQKNRFTASGFFKIYCSEDFDLSIELSNYEKQDIILILGKYDNKIKEISLYRLSKRKILTTNKISTNSEKYFEIHKIMLSRLHYFFNVMHNNKCIQILDENFKLLCSTIYRKGNITKSYFEFETIYEDLYIKKIKDGNCIEIYSFVEKEKLKKLVTTKDSDIVICKRENFNICFLHMKDDKCIAIENTSKKLTGLTYEILKNKSDKLIAIYGIKDGKKVAIYDYNLDCKVDCKDTDNSVFIYNIYFDYTYDDDYCCKKYYFSVISYILYDKNDNIIGLYRNDKALLESNEKESYKLVDNKFILKYKYDKCISIYYFSNNRILEEFSIHAKFSKLLLDTENNSFLPLVTEYNLKTKENSLYVFYTNSFFKIAENYENYYIVDNFLILQDMKNIWEICKTTSNFGCKLICQIILTDDRTLKFNSISSQHYITEKINETIVAVFKITDNNIIKVLENPNGIKEIISSNNQVFFKMDGKIYNILGNEINSLTEHIED